MDHTKITAAISSTSDSDSVSKAVQWEDYQQELARFCSLSAAVNEAKQKKLSLQHKIEDSMKVNEESLSRLNEVEEMREKLEAKKMVMENILMQTKLAKECAKKQEEWLISEVGSLLMAGATLSVSKKRLEESHRSLTEEKGSVHLRNLQRVLRTRQQFMISEVSMLYPVKIVVGPAQEQELESIHDNIREGNSMKHKALNHGSFTIQGLRLSMLPFKQMSFFTDKREIHKTATALGCLAHAVQLIASYLHVPLRYPLRLGGSRSFVIDFAPSVELASSDSSSSEASCTTEKKVEFPLFLDGQDATRAAYGVFLLNKDLEQLLSILDVKSLGPRNLLANLRELLKTIQSPKYLEKLDGYLYS